MTHQDLACQYAAPDSLMEQQVVDFVVVPFVLLAVTHCQGRVENQNLSLVGRMKLILLESLSQKPKALLERK